MHGDVPVLGRDTQANRTNWLTTGFMVAFHLLAVAALFMFTWKAFFCFIGLWVLSINMGIGMGYHRLLTHRGYRTPKWLEYFLAVCGTLSLEGGPIFWVATHRVHHQLTDREGDPHTPNDGGWWSHAGWILSGDALHHETALMARYAPDLAKDRFHVWLSKYHYVAAGFRWMVLRDVGHLPASDAGVARHMAGELRYSYVGLAPFFDARRIAQQLVGGVVDRRRRLA
jgi:fatty-acid desaturase